MAAGGEDEEAASFKWIDAARYAVASVVIVLMVVVVVKAKMVLQPKSLYLSVPGGSVFVSREARRRPQREAALLYLDLGIRAQNPSRRVALCFVNVTAYIFDNSVISAESSSNPERDSMVHFALGDNLFVPPYWEELKHVGIVSKRGQPLDAPYFDMLLELERSNIIIHDLTLRLDGWLSTTTRLASDCYTTTRGPGRRTTTFYCRPLLILFANELNVQTFINKQEAFCVSGGQTRGAN